MINISSNSYIQILNNNLQQYSTILESLQLFQENVRDYTVNFREDILDISEEYSSEKKYQMNETLFDQLYETILRNTLIVQSEQQIMKQLNQLIEISKMFFEQCKITRERIGNKINDILDEMNSIEKSFVSKEIHKQHKEERKQFYIDTKEYTIREEKRQEKRKCEDIQVKTFEKYSERLFLYGEFLTISEMKAIEELTSMKLEKILFNSQEHHWKLKSSQLFSCLENKSHIILIIKTTDNQKFGCYITSSITEQGKPIIDQLGYIFKFTENSISQIQIRDKSNALRIGNERDEDLFSIGKNDIIIKKEERKEKSSYKGNLFSQEIGMSLSMTFSKMKQFIPTFITAFQMSLSEEDISHYLEEWTSLRIDSILFNSEIQSLEKNNEDFSKAILNRSKVIFFIETTEHEKFGCYIDTRIEKLGKYFSDPKTFLFTFRNNSPQKFILQPHRTTNVLEICLSSDWKLFRIGVDDLLVCRNYAPCSCFQSSKSSFDYRGLKNALLGSSGEHNFKLHSLKIIQMK